MAPLLFVAFLVVPLAEIYVISRIGHLLGLPLTLALLLAISLIGAVVVKREGMRTWRAVRASLAAGRMPGRELVDGALVLVGGALLLTPGFLTDAVGLLFVLPVTRPAVRRLLTAVVFRRFLVVRRVARTARRSRVVDGRATRSRSPDERSR